MFSEYMRWKAVLAVVIVILILGLLLFTNAGKKFLEFLRSKMGETASFLFGPRERKSFQMSLSVTQEKRKSFYGQKYSASDSTFLASSIYSLIKVDSGEEKIAGSKRVDLEIKGFKGSFEVTNSDTIKVSGEANYIKIGENERTREKPYQIEIEAIPFGCSPACSFSIDRITSDMIFQSITGEIRKLKADGSIDQIKFLADEKLEVQGFNGFLEFKDSIELKGNATQAKGVDFVYSAQ